jgi:hypothetical protein
MKKITIFIVICAGIVSINFPLAYAQTVSSTTSDSVQTVIQQEISYLENEVQLLIKELQAMNLAQQSLSEKVQSENQMGMVPQSSTPPQLSTPPRAFFVQEEAMVDFGSGFLRGVDMQRNFPTIKPGQIIEGKLTFVCVYSSAEAGMPEFCTVPSGATSSLPDISQAKLTLTINGSSTMIMTDGDGNFSFTIPDNCATNMYHVSIYNGNSYMLDFWANNSAFLACQLKK